MVQYMRKTRRCCFVTFVRTSQYPSLRRWHGNVNSLRRARRNRWRWTPGTGPRTQPQVAWHTIFKNSWQIDGRTGTSANANTISGSVGTSGSNHCIVECNCRCWSWQWTRSCRMWQSWTSIRRWAISKADNNNSNFLSQQSSQQSITLKAPILFTKAGEKALGTKWNPRQIHVDSKVQQPYLEYRQILLSDCRLVWKDDVGYLIPGWWRAGRNSPELHYPWRRLLVSELSVSS